MSKESTKNRKGYRLFLGISKYTNVPMCIVHHVKKTPEEIKDMLHDDSLKHMPPGPIEHTVLDMGNIVEVIGRFPEEEIKRAIIYYTYEYSDNPTK